MAPTTSPICLDTTISAAPDQVSSELGDEVAILNIAAGVYHVLDATGARIWKLIQSPTKVSQVRDTLLREYDVDAERCTNDLLELLTKLSGDGLLKIHASPAE